MDAIQVKVKLLEKGITQSDLARRWGKPLGTVCRVVNRKLKSAALEKKLARAIGVTVEELRNGREKT